MSRRLVLIDSSVWISRFTHQTGDFSRALDDLLLTERAAINPVIRVEVLTGALHEAQYAELDDALKGLHALPISDDVWRQAERVRFQLRRIGRLIPLPDVLIASCAMVHGCELLHADRHFDLMARTIPLKIYRPR